MPEPVVATQTNTDAGSKSEDVKAGETLLVADAQAEGSDPTVKTNAVDETAKAGETQKADAKNDDAAKAESEVKAKVEGAPEKYELKAPDGATLDAELLGELTTVAKELNLTNGSAQKFADMGNKLVEKTVKSIHESQAKSWADARGQWVSEIKRDKEIGGANFAQSRELALRAVRFVGIPELKQVFDSGWGDHPALFRAFVKFGKAIGEDRLIDPDGQFANRGAAEVLYPNQGKQ